MTSASSSVSNRVNQRIAPYAALFGIVIFFLCLYGIWLSRDYSGDDLQYAVAIEQYTTGEVFYHPTGTVRYSAVQGLTDKDIAGRLPLNIRYILEYPASILASNLSRALGWENGVIEPILWLRILAGIGGLVFFYLALHTITRNVWIAVLATVGLGTTLTYWTYSNHIDQSINMVFFLCAGLFVFTRYIKTGLGFYWLPLLCAVASLFNFTAALVAFITGIGLLFFVERRGSLTSGLRKTFLFYTAYGVVIAVVLGIALWIISRTEPLDLNFLKSASFFGHPEYQMEIPRDILRAVLGLGKSQIAFPGYSGSLQELWDRSSSMSKAALLAYYGVILTILVAPLLYFILRYKTLRSEIRRIGSVLVLWFAVFSVFNIWWDPGYIKYWLVPLVSWWALVGLILWHFSEGSSRAYRVASILFAVFIGFTFLINFSSTFYPASQKDANLELVAALNLRSTSQPEDMFISPGTKLDFYLTYFARRNVISTALLDYGTGGNIPFIRSLMDSQIEEHTSAGGSVYLLVPAGTLPETVRDILQLADVSPVGESWNFPGYTILQVEPQ